MRCAFTPRLLCGFAFLSVLLVGAGCHYWDNASGDGRWDNPANWWEISNRTGRNGGRAISPPGPGDDVFFDPAYSVDPCNIPAGFAAQAGAVTVTGGYTGTVTLESASSLDANSVTINDGMVHMLSGSELVLGGGASLTLGAAGELDLDNATLRARAGQYFSADLAGAVDFDEASTISGVADAGITISSAAGTRVYLESVAFEDAQSTAGFYLVLTGEAVAGDVFDGLSFAEVGVGPNTTGTVSIDIPGVATTVTLTYYGFTTPTYSSGETTSQNSADDTIVWGPLAVTFGRAAAWPVTGGIEAAWEATSEHLNRGFFVERGQSRAGPWTRVSGLLPGAGSSRRTRVYGWLDTSPDAASRVYRVVDVERTGRLTPHAAFAVGAEEPAWAAAEAPVATKTPPMAKAAEARAPETVPKRGGSVAAVKGGTGPRWRVVTRGEGVFELALADVGLAAGTPVELTCGGEALYAEHTADLASVRFHVPEYRTRHAGENVVYLQEAASAPVPPDASCSSAPLAPSATATAHIEDNAYYISDYTYITCPGGEEPWYSADWISPGVASWSRAVDLGAVAPGEARLRLRAAGYSSETDVKPDHEIVVRVNGTEIARPAWDGWAALEDEFAIPDGLLVSGVNSLELTGTTIAGASNDALVDWVEVEYDVPLVARGDSFAVELDANVEGEFTVTGFTASDISAFRVEGGASWPLDVTVGGGAGDHDATVAVASGGNGCRVVFAAGAAAGAPERVEAASTVDLAASAGSFSYVLVTPGAFRAAADALAAHRAARGQTVLVAEYEDIIDGFNHGRAGPEGIRALVELHRPRYLLLLGDATTDPLDYSASGETDYLPGIFRNDCLGEVLSDAPYGEIDGDLQVAVGRLPARDPAEATALVGKVIAYEAPWPAASPAVFVGDQDARGNLFKPICEAARTELGVGAATIYIGDGYDGPAARTELHAKAAAGASMVFFAGHGADDRWSSANVLLSADAPTFASTKPTVTVAVSCLNASFGWTSWESLGEQLLRATDAGSWAVLGSIGYADKGAETVFAGEFAREVALGATWGEACLLAKRALPPAARSVRDTFVLLGDPASGGAGADALRMIAPAGGEAFSEGELVRILWSWSGDPGALTLEYSADGGATWVTELAGLANTGGVDWVVPTGASDECLLRLRSAGAAEAVTAKAFLVHSAVGMAESGCGAGEGASPLLGALLLLAGLALQAGRHTEALPGRHVTPT